MRYAYSCVLVYWLDIVRGQQVYLLNNIINMKVPYGGKGA